MAGDNDPNADSEASSDSDHLSTTGLIATRAKRSTAGNLYATLRANLDDEDLQRDLLAEDEGEDAGDYEGSSGAEDREDGEDGEEVEDEDDDDDAAMESSGDENDEENDPDPPREGEVEDLSGEKALKRLERAEMRKKRKAHEARLRLPAWRSRKRVHLAEEVKFEDGGKREGSASLPAGTTPVGGSKKKSERANWLPSALDAPVRQSRRAHAVANREVVHAHLRQSAARSENQRRVMKDAAEREKRKRRMEGMTQEQRLKKCERIERETAKELGRWEREEAERQRLREEALAAKRKRGIDGPVFRYWSGSALWVGEKLRIRRLSHGSRDVESLVLPLEGEEKRKAKEEARLNWPGGIRPSMAAHTIFDLLGAEGNSKTAQDETMQLDGPIHPAQQKDPIRPAQHNHSTPSMKQPATPSMGLGTTTPSSVGASTSTAPQQAPSQPQQGTWLAGTEEHAARTDPPSALEQSSSTIPRNDYMPSAPSLHSIESPAAPIPRPPPQVESQGIGPTKPSTLAKRLPGTHSFSIQPTAPQPPPAPPVPQIRQQAQRTLVVLENFTDLDAAPAPTTPHTTTSRRSKVNKDTTTIFETDPLKSILLPGSYPPFNTEETKYLLAKHKKKQNEQHLVPGPAKPRCALTSWTGRYRDPKTGLIYADMHQYKAIQRVVAGGCQWSSLLGCWVGPAYGAMGRPARGVPDAFAGIERPPPPNAAAASTSTSAASGSSAQVTAPANATTGLVKMEVDG